MKVLFVPGFKEDINTSHHGRNYPRLISTIQEAGYQVEFISIDWNYKTHKHYQEQLLDVYKDHDPNQTVLAGFSFGAITALLVAAERNPREVWLFSLSPYFSEVIGDIPDQWKQSVGKRRIEYFSKTSVSSQLDAIHCPVKLWFGAEEIEQFYNKVDFIPAISDHDSVEFIEIIPRVGHDATNPYYCKSIISKI